MEQRLDITAMPGATEPIAETEHDAAPPTTARGWRRLIPRRSPPASDVVDEPVDPEVVAAAQPTQVIVASPNPDGATSLIPVPQGPPPPPVNRLRRERRTLMREREGLVFHLGGLAYELHRRDMLTSEVAQRRATAIMELDDAVHEIDAHLAAHDRARRAGRRGGVVVVEPVVVGTCLVCRAPFVADARFCSHCGARFAPITSWDAPQTQILPPSAGDV